VKTILHKQKLPKENNYFAKKKWLPDFAEARRVTRKCALQGDIGVECFCPKGNEYKVAKKQQGIVGYCLATFFFKLV